MPPDKDGVCIWVLRHCLFKAVGQVFFERRVLNYWDSQGVMIPQHTGLTLSPWYAFDLFNIVDFEASVLATELLDKQCHKNSPLRVRVDTTASALIKRREKKRCACRRLQIKGLSDVSTSRRRVFGGWVREHENILRLHELFLDARWGNKDVFIVTNRGASASALNDSIKGKYRL